MKLRDLLPFNNISELVASAPQVLLKTEDELEGSVAALKAALDVDDRQASWCERRPRPAASGSGAHGSQLLPKRRSTVENALGRLFGETVGQLGPTVSHAPHLCRCRRAWLEQAGWRDVAVPGARVRR
jgi:hypothetical protein